MKMSTSTEVEPLKSIKDIQKIKQYLLGKESKRDYLLFVLGINIGLRAGDLLSLRVKDVYKNRGVVDSLPLKEQKTDKNRDTMLNQSAKEAIQLYLNSNKLNPDDYLFQSRKGNEPISVGSLHKLIKTTLRELHIKGNYGTHTLRKTFAYQRYANGIPLETLQEILNHSSSKVTLRYIGITKEVIIDAYNSVNL
jgi:integrase